MQDRHIQGVSFLPHHGSDTQLMVPGALEEVGRQRCAQETEAQNWRLIGDVVQC